MNTSSTGDRRRGPIAWIGAFILPVQVLLVTVDPRPAVASPNSLAEFAGSLTEPGFVEDCLGAEGGTILLSLSPTYAEQAAELLDVVGERWGALGAAARISYYEPLDWDAALQCDQPLPPGPRAVVFIELFKDEHGEFKTVRVRVRKPGSCREVAVERGRRPGRCEPAFGYQPHDATQPLPNLPFQPLASPASTRSLRGAEGPQPSRSHGGSRRVGLAAGSVLMGTMVFFLRGVQASLPATDVVGVGLWSGLAWTSSAGVSVLSAYSAATWPSAGGPSRRERHREAALGAALMLFGAASVVGVNVSHRTQSGWNLLHAAGELSVAAGIGLVTHATRKKARFSASLAGVGVRGHF